jgi:integrase
MGLSSVKEVSPMTALRQRMLDDLRIRNYAPSTVLCYMRAVAAFAKHFHKSPEQLGPEEIRQYQLFLLSQKKVKLSTYIQAIAALRFLYRNTLHRKIELDRIPLPRYEQKLPVILTKDEVKALLEAPKKLGDRAMLATLYGAGLRVSEVTSLKVGDIDRSCSPKRFAKYWLPGGSGESPRTGSFLARTPAVRSRAKPSSAPARKRRDWPASPNPCIRIRCGTPSPHICSTTASA